MKIFLIVIYSIVLISCSTMPKNPEKPKQASIPVNYQYDDGMVTVKLSNRFKVPLRYQIHAEDKKVESFLKSIGVITLGAQRDTLLNIFVGQLKEKPELRFSAIFGDLNKQIVKKPLGLPFQVGRSYKIIQGYNGKFSHQSERSKYAIDFSLAVGDTVCAADHGVVVGVISKNRTGGNSKKWIDDANYITLYHPETGLFTQYVHLVYQGSLVSIGDRVVKGQPIGISGMTGFTNISHLHFNVFVPSVGVWESTPIGFEGGYTGTRIRQGVWVKRAW